MSAYDLFALHLSERETAHVDLERRRVVLERIAREKAAQADASASALGPRTSHRPRGFLRLLPGRA
jgi:hypothetical protein